MARVAKIEPAQPAPPFNLEAEESVLGALLLGSTLADGGAGVLDQIQQAGLEPSSFYRESHGLIYRVCAAMIARGQPADAITVADELEQASQIDQVGGKPRIHELAALVPAVSNVGHYARLIVEQAQLRDLIRTGGEIQRLAYERPEDTPALVARAARLVEQLASTSGRGRLEPLWWHEAIHEPVPDQMEYVEGVLERGVLTDIVGLPYLHKSGVALELARKVAAGRGLLLGKHPVKQQANAAYFWADDSRNQELKRIQAYAKATEQDVVPLAFYLNPGITLPDDLPAVKQQIRQHNFGLVVFDSLYNFAPAVDWSKDTAAVVGIYTGLKRLCDDIDGLTVVLVDHAGKPSDANRDRDDSIASYGSVWKAAAVRSSIVVTKKKGALYVSCTGNNIKGFKPARAFFNEQRLELQIAEEEKQPTVTDELIEDEIVRFLEKHPRSSTNHVRKGVGRGRDTVRDALRRLQARGDVVEHGPSDTLFEVDLEVDPPAEKRSGQPGQPRAEVVDPRGFRSGRVNLWSIAPKQHEQAEKVDLSTPPGQPDRGTGSPDKLTLTGRLTPHVVGGNPGRSTGEPDEPQPADPDRGHHDDDEWFA